MVTTTAIVPLQNAGSIGRAGFINSDAGARVVLSRGAYCAAVLVIVLNRLLCVLYYSLSAYVYWRLPSTKFLDILAMYTTFIPISSFNWAIAVQAAFAVIHFTLLSRQLHTARKTLFPCQSWRIKRSRTAAAVTEEQAIQHQDTRGMRNAVTSCLRGASTRFRYVNELRRAIFSVHSPCFDSIFLLRELSEVVLQTHQAYRMEALLSRRIIPRAFTAILVVNCWITPLVHVVYRSPKRASWRRLASIFCDYIMDAATSVIVPSALAWTYAMEYQPAINDFPDTKWYDDVWLVQIINETQIILFASTQDIIVRALMSVGLVFSLEAVSALCEFKHRSTPTSTPQKTTRRELSDSLVQRARKLQRWHSPAYALMAVFGFVVLAAHIHAHTHEDIPMCRLRVYPWWTKAPSCALVTLRCLTDELRHDTNALDNALMHVDTASLRHIVVRHCPKLVMPSRLTRFPALVGLKIYNSSIVAWDDGAALTMTHHPSCRFVFIVRTELPNATVPLGLLSSDFPSSLFDIEFSATNLAVLPEEIERVWPSGLVLYIDHSQITTVPEWLPRKSIFILSFAGNPITQLPSALLEADNTFLVLDGLPISTLPANVSTERVTLRTLRIRRTNVSDVPLWMDNSFLSKTRVSAGSTPLCKGLTSHQPNSLAPWLKLIDCTPLPQVGAFPLQFEDQLS
ncbi:hypothetical protein PINS_up004599 [Pythium insidiosum]|nr:hypothetical protein PINS_up004599 [Pythium insidiosum]